MCFLLLLALTAETHAVHFVLLLGLPLNKRRDICQHILLLTHLQLPRNRILSLALHESLSLDGCAHDRHALVFVHGWLLIR